MHSLMQGRGKQKQLLRSALWTISRTISIPLGREQDVKAVLASLKQHGAAFIWAGPGEGKTTIAMEAAEQLRSHEEHLSAFEIDMQGESSALL